MRERLKRVLGSSSRISTQLQIAIWGAVALTMCASLVGWLSFNSVGDVQSQVNEGSIPDIVASFAVAQDTGKLAAAAPRLTAATTEEEFEEVVADIDEARSSFEQQLALLEESNVGAESFVSVRDDANMLISNIDALKEATSDSFALNAASENLAAQLAKLRTELDSIIIPAIDDQLFYFEEGSWTRDQLQAPRIAHFSQAQFDRYRRLVLLQVEGSVAMELLANAFTLSQASLIEPLEERFEAATDKMEDELSALGDSPLRAQVTPIFDRLIELGTGEGTGFELLRDRLELQEDQQVLVVDNRDIAVDLVADVNGLVAASRASAEAATQASSDAIFTGRTLLLAISGVSVAGALLIAWLFVGRILIRRLMLLSDWMRRMAGGDLEARVDIEGRDEVAEMAAALEVFRRHALEVQRLNLVEKLADELQVKNEELEVVLEDLRLAQNQIVVREKLAALGELTAGVAHEIRNPLNFINNFSEVSEELIKEMQEVLDEEGAVAEGQKGTIDEIFGDLSGNLGRIRSHGQQANRIVQDMLQMGRDSGDIQSTDINSLLEEHARLAYHSTRATDPDFQLDLKHDFDPDMGEIEVIPQEMGRVFLNMVSNACYATDEKRRSNAEANGGPYMPTLVLITRRGEEHAEVRIRDNGSGMPPEVVEKIFNPFFTTKPTDKGTGLGLAMSMDIVRKHGGAIRVESEPGQFTEMIVEIPLTPPVNVEEETEPAAAPEGN